ncbi:Rho GTPase-activating protein 19 [Dermatophagoides pteronyssinus]|uniref:Rho GTPase-activating protein 19 n=1 Tax=Dermatophagoides pteronyssinus TaxID=6956 RepID=A0ABQ8J8H3_DERPT|nr:Rho GTPase-activating protein 19 [Dermatophagoides pteronyssinus]
MINLHPTLQKVSSISKVAYRSMIATELARLLNADFKLNFIDHDDNDNNNSNNNDKSATIFGATLTFEGICSISQLIDYISKPDQIIEEGLFRKSGVRSRQQELRTMISSGQTIEIDCQKYSVHDCCDLLKRFVSELPQSILTNELQKFFLQSLRLESGQKQLDTIRLLILLLPAPNRNFLYELLTLFDNIAKHSNQNRMNIENLATIFSPSIFRCQWSMTTSKSLSSSSTNSSHQQSNTVQNMLLANQESIQCLSIMIQNVRLIFEPPEKLINDAVIYLSNHIRLQKRTSGPENMISVTNLSALPTTKFCATTEQHYSAKDYTERQLAELYAQMQSMASQSPSIQKKLKKFNHLKTSAATTPKNLLKRDKKQQELIKQSLKKSASIKKSTDKGLKSLFKKIMMTPNSERKRRVSSSSSPSSVSESSSITPVITTTAPNSTPKTSKKSVDDNSMSPRSIVPLDEKTISELPVSPIGRNNSKSTLIFKRRPSQTFHQTKLPIAIVTPTTTVASKLENHDHQEKKPRLPTPIRSCSNSIISSTLLSRAYHTQAPMTTIPERIDGKENHRNNNANNTDVRLPMKMIRSLPTPLRNYNNNNDDNDDQANEDDKDDDENIRRKRVKYLASVYEQLISLQNQNSTTTTGNKQSRIPIINRSISSNLRIESNQRPSSSSTTTTSTNTIRHPTPKRSSNSMRITSKHTRL